MKLSVLIPVYNEVETILQILSEIQKVDVDKEIIVVDDASTDGTAKVLKEKFSEYSHDDSLRVLFHHKNLGKGAAIKTALEHARGDYSIIQDGDLEYDPNDYLTLLNKAQNLNADVVFGSRFKVTWRTTSFWHYLVNGFLTFITNVLYRSNLTDMETCYKMIKTNLFRDLDIKSQRFEIEPEITAKLLKKGLKIIEVPISYKGRSYHEGKKIGWQDGLTTLLALFRYRF